MKKQFCKAVLAIGVVGLSTFAIAQPFYVRGDFNGYGTTDQLLDDGVPPDAAAADGIYTVDVAGIGSAGTWKAADASWTVQYPASGTANTHYPAGNVTFYYDTVQSLAYTSPILTRTSYTAVGSFTSEAGGSDWTPGDTNFNLADDGVAPDVSAADGIYSIEVMIDTIGTNYEYKIATEGTWNDFQFGADGFHNNASTIFFDTTVVNELVNFYVDTNINSIAVVPSGVAEVDDWMLLNEI